MATPLQVQEVLELAYRVGRGVDQVVDCLEGWTPQEMIVLCAALARAVVEHHPEAREAAISQLGLALHKIETYGEEGN